MSDKTITQLPADSQADLSDILVVVDGPTSVTKKLTLAQVQTLLGSGGSDPIDLVSAITASDITLSVDGNDLVIPLANLTDAGLISPSDYSALQILIAGMPMVNIGGSPFETMDFSSAQSATAGNMYRQTFVWDGTATAAEDTGYVDRMVFYGLASNGATGPITISVLDGSGATLTSKVVLAETLPAPAGTGLTTPVTVDFTTGFNSSDGDTRTIIIDSTATSNSFDISYPNMNGNSFLTGVEYSNDAGATWTVWGAGSLAMAVEMFDMTNIIGTQLGAYATSSEVTSDSLYISTSSSANVRGGLKSVTSGENLVFDVDFRYGAKDLHIVASGSLSNITGYELVINNIRPGLMQAGASFLNTDFSSGDNVKIYAQSSGVGSITYTASVQSIFPIDIANVN